MEIIKVKSYSELEQEVDKLKTHLESKRTTPYDNISRPLFRGHRSSSWGLETTLERYLHETMSLKNYNRYLCAIQPAVESLTGRAWEVTHSPNLDDDHIFSPPNISFMAYTRHHGFPSPLLDWSQSWYVALFFAFQNARTDDDVAIYAYVEYLGVGKGGWVGVPQISEIGPYISTDKRHFMQQGQYTICVEKCENQWVYCSHERAFVESGSEDQDLLYKFILPGSIKNNVLIRLQAMNINAFTLLGNEEGLMDMVAFKEMVANKMVRTNLLS